MGPLRTTIMESIVRNIQDGIGTLSKDRTHLSVSDEASGGGGGNVAPCLDVNTLKKQYLKIRERQKQVQGIIKGSCSG